MSTYYSPRVNLPEDCQRPLRLNRGFLGRDSEKGEVAKLDAERNSRVESSHCTVIPIRPLLVRDAKTDGNMPPRVAVDGHCSACKVAHRSLIIGDLVIAFTILTARPCEVTVAHHVVSHGPSKRLWPTIVLILDS